MATTMPNSINGSHSLNALLPKVAEVDGFSQPSDPGAVDFQQLLVDAVGRTNEIEQAAQSAIQQYETGSGITKPEVFVAIRKAELALRLTMQIRNKLLEAYDEIKQMRM